MIEKTLEERGARYGDFNNHALISQDFKHVLNMHLRMKRKDIAPDQKEALEMILHKIARIINGDADYPDSWHDIAGYATLVEKRLKGEVL